jgi:hypothetical protein
VVCDAGNGWGQVAGLRAMELCIKSAKRYGVGVATVKRSNHFGLASFYTLAASRAGLIGLVMSNTGPSMAAWGGKTPVLGTNPISVAAPAPWGEFCLDMALTTVAKSRIRLAGKEGHEIPPTWALDEFGRPTTDPTIALKGTLQPAGGAKGYAAALLVDPTERSLEWRSICNGCARFDGFQWVGERRSVRGCLRSSIFLRVRRMGAAPYRLGCKNQGRPGRCSDPRRTSRGCTQPKCCAWNIHWT